jgi:hypothetical protein
MLGEIVSQDQVRTAPALEGGLLRQADTFTIGPDGIVEMSIADADRLMPYSWDWRETAPTTVHALIRPS